MKKGVPANRYTLFIHSLFYSFVISFIGLRRVNGTFLLHGLRTEFKRIWPSAIGLAPYRLACGTVMADFFQL